MAITKRSKSDRIWQVQETKFLALSPGVQPPLESVPAPYLPFVKYDRAFDAWRVIEAGQIVAFDRSSLNGGAVANLKWLVPANGGAAQVVTYSANDVSECADIDGYEAGVPAVVAAAGAASKNIAANIPAGFAPYDYFSGAHELVYHNFKLQGAVGFVTDYLIELPLEFDSGAAGVAQGQDQSTIVTGCLLKSGPLGWPVFWDPTTDTVDQIVGRAVRVDPITVKDALDKVVTVPGLALTGTGTGGRQTHENGYLLGTTTKVTRKVKINITLL